MKDGKDTDTEFFFTCNAELTDYQVKRAVDEFHNMLLFWASMKAEEVRSEPKCFNKETQSWEEIVQPISMPIWNSPHFVYPSFPQYDYSTKPFKITCSN